MQPVSNQNLQVANYERTGSAASLFVQAASYVAVLALRLAAWALSFFGQCGQAKAQSLRYQAKKIYVVNIHHPNLSYCSSPLPLLAYSKNIAKCEVISSEEDICAANEMRKRFLCPDFQNKYHLPSQSIQKLQAVTFKGAKKSGICKGATLWFLREALAGKVKSEEELQRIAKAFEEGFPKEAAGLHALYSKCRPDSSTLKQEFKRQIDQLEEQIPNAATQEEFGALTHKLHELRSRFFDKGYQARAAHNVAFAELIGLKAEFCADNVADFAFHTFESDEAVRARFDQLPEGAYQLSFKVEKLEGHALALLKYGFGTYLFDPNKGLMPCSSLAPSEALTKLLQAYPKNGSRELEVYAYSVS